MATTGYYPVFENKFRVNISAPGSAEEMSIVGEMESFSVSIDGKTQEWTPLELEGWTRREVTGKSFSISLKGKRSIGDPGNDYIAEAAWKTGRDCRTSAEWEFPSGSKLTFDCVINVTAPGGGESTDIDTLEFELLSNGKPKYTAPPQQLKASK